MVQVTDFDYRIYSNKRGGAYLIFRATRAAFIRGRRLLRRCTRQIYFSYIFIKRYASGVQRLFEGGAY